MINHNLFLKQFNSLIDNDQHIISIYSNTSAFINEILNDINWAGFYFTDDNKDLYLGPFQGKVACVHIQYGKGVCGTAVQLNKTIRVDNVHEFEGHIACDSASNSEIVIPVRVDDKIVGVLDIDSPVYNRFTDEDQELLEGIVKILEDKIKTSRL